MAGEGLTEARFECKPEAGEEVRLPGDEHSRHREQHKQRPWDKNVPGM